jgi:hypothetical protein
VKTPADSGPEGLTRERTETALAIGARLTEQGRRDEALTWLRAAAFMGHAEAAVWCGAALGARHTQAGLSFQCLAQRG